MLVVLASKVIPSPTAGVAEPRRPRSRCVPIRGGRRTLKPHLRPEIRRDYPLNLSISISGGKETNKDSLSNGE